MLRTIQKHNSISFLLWLLFSYVICAVLVTPKHSIHKFDSVSQTKTSSGTVLCAMVLLCRTVLCCTSISRRLVDACVRSTDRPTISFHFISFHFISFCCCFCIYEFFVTCIFLRLFVRSLLLLLLLLCFILFFSFLFVDFVVNILLQCVVAIEQLK